jgi:hypothetical protein
MDGIEHVEHIESQSFPGVDVVKVFFRPHANVQAALAQVVSVSRAVPREMAADVTHCDERYQWLWTCTNKRPTFCMSRGSTRLEISGRKVSVRSR